eukprot:scaffold18557_cov25-Cyclotella_meneghiniana.AAC.5
MMRHMRPRPPSTTAFAAADHPVANPLPLPADPPAVRANPPADPEESPDKEEELELPAAANYEEESPFRLGLLAPSVFCVCSHITTSKIACGSMIDRCNRRARVR